MLSSCIQIESLAQSTFEFFETRRYYFEYMRNIQYYLPNHIYNDRDKNILLTNARHFSGHSKYLVHLIKCMNWDHLTMCDMDEYYENEKLIVEILASNKTKSCKDELFCVRNCEKNFSIDDIFTILFSTFEYLPDNILSVLFSTLDRYANIMEYYLPLFVYFISRNTINKNINKYILKIVNYNVKYQYLMYWYLMSKKTECKESEEEDKINIFLELLDPELLKIMYKEYTFYSGLISNINSVEKYLKSNFKRVCPLSLPYDPDTKIVDIDYNSIVTGDSHTKPIFITVTTNKETQIQLLFKNSSIMNDLIILNLINICDSNLRETVMTDLISSTYNVVPITGKSGMIEIVRKAKTVQYINTVDSRKNIFRYILTQNKKEPLDNVLKRYTYSFVSYTLSSYFFGIGDRHLENIMVTNDGRIFNIDFGFILGKEAQPITLSEVRIIPEMIEVLGNEDDEEYILYKKLCMNGIVILRKNYNLFYIMLNLLEDSGIKSNDIEAFVNKRCLPGQKDKNIIDKITNIIISSQNSVSDNVRDLFHTITKEKTIGNNLEYFLSKGYDFYRYMIPEGS